MKRNIGFFLFLIGAFSGFVRAGHPPDGIQLMATEGPGIGEVTLDWSGGLPQFRVFRSTDPATLLDPLNEIDQTANFIYTDTLPAGDLFFYKIVSPYQYAVEWNQTMGDPILKGEQEHPGRPLSEVFVQISLGDTTTPVSVGPVMIHSGEVVLPAGSDAFSIPGKDAANHEIILQSEGYTSRNNHPDFAWAPTYRSQIDYQAIVGAGWILDSLSDRIRMTTASGPGTAGSAMVLPAIRRFDAGQGRYDDFVEVTAGGPLHARGFFQEGEFNFDGSKHIIRHRDGVKTTYLGFNGLPTDGALSRREDRNGNFMEFVYDGSGRLTAVVDSMGRAIDYLYSFTDGHLAEIQDFIGRSTTFTYDSVCNHLTGITTPAVTGTPNSDDGIAANGPSGNDFPAGKTTRFRYDCGNPDTILRDNLLGITSPNEVATGGPERITFTYGTDPADPMTYDRVTAMEVGGGRINIDPVTGASTGVPAGGTYTFVYQDLAPRNPGVDLTTEVRKTTVTDPNDNLTEYFFNSDFHCLRAVVHTNRIVNPNDPATFTTQKEWTADSLVTRIVHPEGNEILLDYDTTSVNRYSQGNLLSVTEVADPARGGDQAQVKRSFTYEPIFNQLRTWTLPRGNDASFVPPILDDPSIIELIDLNLDGDTADTGIGEDFPVIRYTGLELFDYQERTANEISLKSASERVDLDLDDSGPLTANDVAEALSLGNTLSVDLNGDGNTSQEAGNVIEVRHPTVHLIGGGGQQIVETWTYNSHGQVTSRADPEGILTTFYYNPESDPDGNLISEGLVRAGVDTVTGGYLHSVFAADDPVKAAGASIDPLRPAGQTITNAGTVRRLRTAPFTEIRSLRQYDPVGNLTAFTDGRSIQTAFRVNELNQVVEKIYVNIHSDFLPDPPEPNPLIDFQYRERFLFDFNDNLIRHQIEDRGDTSTVGGDNTGTGTSFVDRVIRYDLVDRPIHFTVEVDDSLDLVTRYRYDPNGDRVLKILPAGNAVAAIYDERRNLFRMTTGDESPPPLAQMASSDPVNFDVRGGVPSTTTYTYDWNGSLVEIADAGDTDASTANNSTIPGAGDRTRFIRDGFDRLTSFVDSVGNQSAIQYDPDGNEVRVSRFGPVGGASPTADGPDPLLVPVSSGGVIQQANFFNGRFLTAREMLHDELNRKFQVDGILGAETISLVRPVDLQDGAADIGKGNLTPGDIQAIPGVSGATILGRVSQRVDFDRNSMPVVYTEDDGDTYSFGYDPSNRLVDMVDPEGNSVEVAWDDNDNPIEIRETDVSQVAGVADEIFLTTRYFDALNRPERTVNNLGHTIDYRYNSRGLPVAMADANGPAGPPIARRAFPDGPRTVNTTNLFGNITLSQYDGLGRRLKTESILTASGLGDGISIGADFFGVMSTPPPADPSQGGGDGRITRVIEWDANAGVQNGRDDGWANYLMIDRQVDDNGNETVMEYDNQNRRIAVTRGACVAPFLADRCDPSTTIAYGYDRDSNLIQVTDEIGNVILTDFDAVNRPISRSISPAPGVIGTTAETYQFDGLYRVTKATHNNDPADANDDSTVTRAYDTLGRVIEATQEIGSIGAKVISQGWRAENLPTVLTYPNGRQIDHRFDRVDRYTFILEVGGGPSTQITSHEYIGPYRLAKKTFDNGAELSFLAPGGAGGPPTDVGYDGLRQAIQVGHTRPDSTLIVAYGHGFDRMNNRMSESKFHDPANDEVYGRDSAYRLTSFVRGSIFAQPPLHGSWSLDGIGNWKQVDGETRQHSSFNELIERATLAGTIPILSDDNGNETDEGDYLFEHDYRNRLRRATRKSDGMVVGEYDYDAENRRIRKVVTNSGPLIGETRYYFHLLSGNPIEERDGTDALTRQYVYGVQPSGAGSGPGPGDQVPDYLDVDSDGDGIATGPGDIRYTHHRNTVGAAHAITVGAAQIAQGYLFEAYGMPTVYEPGLNGVVDFGGDDIITTGGASAIGPTSLLAGHILDAETGLYSSGSRNFSPVQGRFIDRYAAGEDTLSTRDDYLYVANESAGSGKIPQTDYHFSIPASSSSTGLLIPAVMMAREAARGKPYGSIVLTSGRIQPLGSPPPRSDLFPVLMRGVSAVGKASNLNFQVLYSRDFPSSSSADREYRYVSIRRFLPRSRGFGFVTIESSRPASSGGEGYLIFEAGQVRPTSRGFGFFTIEPSRPDPEEVYLFFATSEIGGPYP